MSLAHSAAEEENERAHEEQIHKLQVEVEAASAQAEEANTQAETARRLALAEMAQRELLEMALRETHEREVRRFAADKRSKLAATCEALQAALAFEGLLPRSPTLLKSRHERGSRSSDKRRVASP